MVCTRLLHIVGDSILRKQLVLLNVSCQSFFYSREVYLISGFFLKLCLLKNENGSVRFDVIGEVAQVGRLRDFCSSNRSSRSIDFVLRDQDQNKLNCTVWDVYVGVLTTHLEKPTDVPVVLIIQLRRSRFYCGKDGLSNTFYATKLIFDGELPEIGDFRSDDDECSKKLSREGDSFYCQKCKTVASIGTWRYTLRLRIEDNKSFVIVIIWDRECRELLMKSVEERQGHSTQDHTYRSMCHSDVHSLIDKQLVLKVQTKLRIESEHGRQFFVLKVKDGGDDIETYVCNDESTRKDSDSDTDLAGLFDSACDDGLKVDESSADLSEPTTVTPLKRCLDFGTAVVNDASSTQSSSNKLKKIIKVEK